MKPKPIPQPQQPPPMHPAGYIYLHTNGSLIYKRYLDDGQVADFRESPFVVAFWTVHPDDRESGWRIIVESLAAGAPVIEVMSYANHHGFNDDDAQEYARRVGCVLEKDGDQWCAHRRDFTNLQESPAGFGKTCLEAMAELAKALGYRPQKAWHRGFKELLA